MEKMAWGGRKWGQEALFPANPDPAFILGDMDLGFDKFHSINFSGLQISGFPGYLISKIWPRLGLGQA